MEFFWLLLVGLIAGWLAGGYLFRAPGFSRVVDFFGSILVATFGAIVLIVILRMIKRA